MTQSREKSERSPARRDRGHPELRLWRALCSAATLILIPTMLTAQPFQLDTPVGSPMWWTLTDQLTPAELKQQLTDPELILERYGDAVAAGDEQPLPKTGVRESEEGLIYYVNRKRTPELEPMWAAFRSFGFYVPEEGSKVQDPTARAGLRALVEEYGLSSTGLDTILDVYRSTETAVDELNARLAPARAEMNRLLDDLYSDPVRAASSPPRAKLYESVLQKDYQAVANVVGRTESDIQDAVDSHADWNDSYELVAEALPELKQRLSANDWENFRRYLLEYVVPNGGNVTFFVEYYEEAGR